MTCYYRNRIVEKAVCGRCEYFLGMKNGEGEFSVRTGDLYFYFEGGMLTLLCRGCACPNLIVVNPEYEKSHAQAIEHLLKRNIVRAEFHHWKSRKEKEAEKSNHLTPIKPGEK